MSSSKRYDNYPRMAQMVRAFSPGAREVCRAWHTALLQGYRNFVAAAPAECGLPLTGGDVEAVLDSWLRVMEDLAGLFSDVRPADWCCKRGMMAFPEPCPAHPLPLPGAVRARETAEGAEVYEVMGVAGNWLPLAAAEPPTHPEVGSEFRRIDPEDQTLPRGDRDD